jgi:DNA-directed RNA polymerase sigma subunit (sigma70/sigma32)
VGPEQNVHAREFRRLLSTVMRRDLADVEQAALCRRFGLADLEDPAGGRRLPACSRERVRWLEVRALRKLQTSAHAEHLLVFLPSSSAPSAR